MSAVFEVFYRFIALGCVSFGGPAAHIGYFQTTFVQKLKWVDQDAYAKLVALSQFLPGPGSSQVGFAIGLRRAGLFGGLAAFIGFTLPSFLLLYLLACVSSSLSSHFVFVGIVYGLKLLAVVVVADACVTMFITFCKHKLTICLAIFSAATLLVIPNLFTQIGVLVMAALIGALLSKSKANTNHQNTQIKIGLIPIFLFLIFLIGAPMLSGSNQWLDLFSDFYYSGSLVFGGGHVVLPLLQQSVGEALSTDQFLTGYAAAQAVPGPMFSLAAYLGAQVMPDHQLLGAAIATAGIFIPGFLLVLALQGTWETLTGMPKVSGAAAAINAAVVGILVAALYKPIFISAVGSSVDMIVVLLGYLALRLLSAPIVLLVIAFAVLGVFIQ